MADQRRRLQRPPAQSAHADHARERQSTRGAVDVSDRHARQLPDDADRHRRRAVRHRVQQQRVGDRRALGTHDLALSPRSAGGLARLLWRGQPRLRRARRSPVHDDHRCAPRGARHADRRRAVRRRARGLQARVLRHGRAADREGQGHSRHCRRRVRHPRIHRRLRRADRQTRVALLHRCRTGRPGRQDVAAGRRLPARRRLDLGDRHLRSAAEPDLLRHRQSGARLLQQRA